MFINYNNLDIDKDIYAIDYLNLFLLSNLTNTKICHTIFPTSTVFLTNNSRISAE